MPERRFADSSNPPFDCAAGVVLLPFGRDSYLAAAVERYGGEAVELDETTDRLVYRLGGEADGLTLLYSGMGSPAAANALEMAAANGARRVVLFGACGGTAERVAVGDLIVASAAVRGEGTSRYYAPAGYPAACDPRLTAELWRRVRDGAPAGAHQGVVYTTDAGYRQGREVYEQCAGLVLGVECECAAAAVVAARLGLVLGAVLFVTDNVTLVEPGDRRYRGLADKRVRRAFEHGLAAAVGALGAAP